jgi:hypothetical protein
LRHAEWTDELLAKLGVRADRELADAVAREARAQLQIIERATPRREWVRSESGPRTSGSASASKCSAPMIPPASVLEPL